MYQRNREFLCEKLEQYGHLTGVAAGRVPVIFGLNATDPTRSVYEYIREIKEAGFSGVNNYPTVE